VRVLLIAGRPWTVIFDAEPTLVPHARFPYVPVTAAAGIAVSLVLFLLALRLERSRRDAERANLAKARFLANMSHELRTPLNAICGYIDLLQAGVYGPVREDQASAIERIKVASAHLLRLIEDVLTFARLEAGRTSYTFRPLALSDALERAEALILPQARAAGLRYRRADDPHGDPWVAVVADPDKLQQVLLNLLSNAVKFTPPGGEIVVSTTHHPHHVDISIEDSGIGISKEEMDALFAPFVQIDGALTREHQGAGLGLAISRELARGMGGEITAVSTPGAGSVFRLVLPRAVPTGPAADRTSPGKP
jgi:signal transduction histidine kinase